MNFEDCMNTPEKYQPSDLEINLLVKISEIIGKGHSAEVKKSKDGFTVYDVVKEKK